jgi:hypothetical protein
VAPSKAPWIFCADAVRVDGTGADEPFVTPLRSGCGEGLGDAHVDEQHLEVASVSAQIPMSDGSIFDFAGTWQATSARFVYGNDSPATGAPHHFVDGCPTGVAIGREKLRYASMTGTLDGAPVHSYSGGSAGIFSGNYRYIFQATSPCRRTATPSKTRSARTGRRSSANRTRST